MEQTVEPRIMYIELKDVPDGHTDRGPASIGRVFFNKSGKTLIYQGKKFQKKNAGCANYRDIETGEFYWISGPKKNGQDRYNWASRTPVEIDDDVREEYWLNIRNQPEKIKETTTR
jgi:hypothetical protein